jgi:hypothetical protein
MSCIRHASRSWFVIASTGRFRSSDEPPRRRAMTQGVGGGTLIAWVKDADGNVIGLLQPA